jgi:hypothetical protein
MPPDLKFPSVKSLQPQERLSDVSSLLKRITEEEQPITAASHEAPHAGVSKRPHTAPSASVQPSAVVLKESKLTARLPKGIHHRLRVHATMLGKTMENFVIELLDQELPRGLGETELDESE